MRDDATSVASSAADAAAAGTSAVACDAAAARLSPARVHSARRAAADQSTRPPCAAPAAELPPRADLRSGTHRRERRTQQVAARAALLARQRRRHARLVLAPQLARGVHHRARCGQTHKRGGASALARRAGRSTPQTRWARGRVPRRSSLADTGAPRKDETRPRGVSRADAPVGRATARSCRAAADISLGARNKWRSAPPWRLLTSRATDKRVAKTRAPFPRRVSLPFAGADAACGAVWRRQVATSEPRATRSTTAQRGTSRAACGSASALITALTTGTVALLTRMR